MEYKLRKQKGRKSKVKVGRSIEIHFYMELIELA